MKKNIACILLIALLGITVSASIAQQNQNVPKTDTEVEKLKIQLQTVENEKIGLETKLAEAKAKLLDTEIENYKRGLKDENDEWLREWTTWFIVIIGLVGVVFWYWLRSRADQLIVTEVEKSLNDFQDSIKQVTILQDQMRYLLKEHAQSLLGDFSAGILTELDKHTEQVKALSKEVLLDIFNDKTRDIEFKWLAAEVLVARKYLDFVAPLLNFLKDIVNSNDFDSIYIFPYDPRYHISSLLLPIGKIHTQEAYKCLRSFIKHLQTENPKNKDSWIAWTAHSLASVSVALNKKESTSFLIGSIPDWDFTTGIVTQEHETLTEMINYFNLLNAPKGIKGILTNGLTDNLPEVEKRCLELLSEEYSEFVNEWKAQKEDTNTEREETDESKPTN